MITQSQYTQIKFASKLDNVKSLYNALKSIHFHDDVKMIISTEGFRAVVEDAKFIQASAYVTRDCFTEYSLENDEEFSIRVNLNVVCDCLSIFTGIDSKLKIYYKGDGAPLVFVIEQTGEGDLLTECSIKTKTDDDKVSFSLDENDDSYNSIIVRGPDFSTMINEINKSADQLEILLSPNEPYFRLTTLGVVQSESHIEVAESSDMMLMFLCKQTSSNRYRMSHIRYTLKSMLLASKVAIRTDVSGLLELQMLLYTLEKAQIYIQFYISPLIDIFDD